MLPEGSYINAFNLSFADPASMGPVKVRTTAGISGATAELARRVAGDKAARVTACFSRPDHLPPKWRWGVRSVRATLRSLQAAGAKLDVVWIHPEDLSPAEREQLAHWA